MGIWALPRRLKSPPAGRPPRKTASKAFLTADRAEKQKISTDKTDIKRKNDQGTPAFTIGNAQKWVNMTIKNLYILLSVKKMIGEDGGDSVLKTLINSDENDCHVPIDNYLLQYAFHPKTGDDKAKRIGNESNNDQIWILKETETQYKVRLNDNEYVAWSNISTYDDYEKIQEALRECLLSSELLEGNILDKENAAWIEIKTLRKNA